MSAPTTIQQALDYLAARTRVLEKDLVYAAENKEGSTISAGQACAVHSSGTGVVLACAADAAVPAVGLVQTDTLDTVAGNIQIAGLFQMDDWTAVTGTTTLSAHAIYFLDPVTPGMLTTTAPTTPGQVVQVVGRAVFTDTLDLVFDTCILL